MPTVPFIPRGAEYCYYYKALMRYFIGIQIKGLSLPVLVQWVLLLIQGSCPSSVRRSNLLCIFWSVLWLSLWTIGWQESILECFILLNVCNLLTMICSSKMFRFGREHFYQVLVAMKLDGSRSSSILCRRKGTDIKNRAQYFPADICLLIFLQRMAFPCRFVDLVNIFGLPTNRICNIYH